MFLTQFGLRCFYSLPAHFKIMFPMAVRYHQPESDCTGVAGLAAGNEAKIIHELIFNGTTGSIGSRRIGRRAWRTSIEGI